MRVLPRFILTATFLFALGLTTCSLGPATTGTGFVTGDGSLTIPISSQIVITLMEGGFQRSFQ